MTTIHKALALVPNQCRLHIKTDSRWAINVLCENIENSTDANFAYTSHANLIKPIINRMHHRGGNTSFEWIKGHTSITGNEGTNALAAIGTSMDNTTKMIFIANPDFNYNGARLATLTQATAYKLIIRQNKNKIANRMRTMANLDLTRETIQKIDNCSPVNERIWHAIMNNHRDLSINIRSFLWKLIHDTHKCGTYWSKMANYEEHSICTSCEMVETMNHILFKCKANQCDLIWKTTREICERKNIPWLQSLDTTTIMALPLLKVKTNTGKTHQGATCLFLITVSKCAFLIWKLRCKRILEPGHQETITAREARNQIMSTINCRLNQDRTLTSKKRYSKKALPENLVLSTWSRMLKDEHDLPRKWLTANGVLVGRANDHSVSSIG